MISHLPHKHCTRNVTLHLNGTVCVWVCVWGGGGAGDYVFMAGLCILVWHWQTRKAYSLYFMPIQPQDNNFPCYVFQSNWPSLDMF